MNNDYELTLTNEEMIDLIRLLYDEKEFLRNEYKYYEKSKRHLIEVRLDNITSIEEKIDNKKKKYY